MQFSFYREFIFCWEDVVRTIGTDCEDVLSLRAMVLPLSSSQSTRRQFKFIATPRSLQIFQITVNLWGGKNLALNFNFVCNSM